MDRNKKQFKPFQRKNPNNTQFKKKGQPPNKKGKWNNSSKREQSSTDSAGQETIYRILCESKKIGSVIGRGGGIVKALRDETRSKITVAESVPGSDERVIIIYSNSSKAKTQMKPNGDETMEPHCAAQDALMRVHERIVEEDLVGGPNNQGNNEVVISARLLVPNNMVGCVLGKKGDVIQRLRSETGANVRVLPSDNLPSCATNTDELVQISGPPSIVKRALYEVSTLLHNNPRKDQPASQSFRTRGPSAANMVPLGEPMWSNQNPNPHAIPPQMQWSSGYRNDPPPPPLPHGGGGGATGEFFMKILCPPSKIGSIIGKGGANVRQLQLESGAGIHAEDVTGESDERVIRVSAAEDPWIPRSQTIDGILLLQNLTAEPNEKGVIKTRLLVPSDKVGCIIGQGGQLINEMRRRTRADIRVFTKDEKPKFASAEEELVQISGSFGVTKEALGEISSRLRDRFLRDTKSGPERGPARPIPGFGPPGGRTPPFGSIRPGTSSGGYESLKGIEREYEHHPSYPVPLGPTGYSDFNRGIELPNRHIPPPMGAGGSITTDYGGTRILLQDRHTGGGAECVVEIRGGASQHLNQAYQAYMASTAPSLIQNYNNSSNDYHIPATTITTQQQPLPPQQPPQLPPGAYSNINNVVTQTIPHQSGSNPPQHPYYNYHTTPQQPPAPYSYPL
jgi:poly(rC)-binding protein 2/3/4